MNLEKFILAAPSVIVLKCDEDSEAVRLKLTEICGEEAAGIKEKQSKDGVTLKENVGFLQSLYKPRLEGKLEENVDIDGGGTRLTLIARPSPLISYFVEQSGSAIAGAAIAMVASAYLSPNPIALAYTFIATFILPALFFAVLISLARRTSPESLAKMKETLEKNFGASESQEAGIVFQEHSITKKLCSGALATIVFLGVAATLHGAAYQFWVSGDYKSSQYLCQPVAAITRAFLDDDSAVVADTNYYLAETLRCQGKLEAARLLYEKVLETFEKDIGKRHRFVGDVTFNLGRIYEEEGDLDKAKSLYERTIAIWSKDKNIGKDNILTNRVKNRLAIVLLKQNKIDEAKIILTRVLKKDKLYSSTVAGAAVAEDRNDLAVAQLMSGDVDSARANFLKALDQKESLSTVFNLAVLESRYGDLAKAKSYLDRVNTLVQSDLSLDNLKNTDMLPDSFLKEYETLVEKQRPSYESPTYDTRGNVIINLEGRK